MPNINIFVACHHPIFVPNHPLLIPIQVGAALTSERFPGFLYDDTGDNISSKNRSYCELTAQYWAWKNINVDYYGFFHYRRYLFPAINAKKPYYVRHKASNLILEKLEYHRLEQIVLEYDLIVPKCENMHCSVRRHYVNAPFHHEKDFSLMEEILRELYPAYIPAMEEYFSQTYCYFGNIYIMCRDVFFEYCEWLFSILFEFDRRSVLFGYSEQDLRVNGYLAERLLGVYIMKQRQDGQRSVLELPRVHFAEKRYLRQQMVNFFLPPGSKRRSFVKAFKRGKR